MLTPGSMTWTQAIPTILWAVAVLWLPGAAVVLALGGRTLTALALGPPLSATVIVGIGTLAPMLGMPWNRLLILGLLVVAALVVIVVAALRRRRPESWLEVVAGAVGVAAACTLVTRLLTEASRSPRVFPQHPDTIFHLGQAQWMVENLDVSLLHGTSFLSGGLTGGYPIAYHALTATVSLLAGVPVVVATSAMSVVVGGLVWPVGALALARICLGPGPAVSGVAPLSSVLLTPFPYMLMTFGTLWPNMLGGAFIPGVLAAVASLSSRIHPMPETLDRDRISAIGILAALPGLTLAHPQATISTYLFGVCLVMTAAARRGWRDRSRGRSAWFPLALAGGVSLAGVAALMWLRPSAMLLSGTIGPELTSAEALVDTVGFAPRGTGIPYAVAVAVLIGAIAAVVRIRGALWAVPSTLMMMALFYVNTAVDTRAARTLTWPWYNNAVRIASAEMVPVVLLVATGLTALGALAVRRVTAHRTLAAGVATALVAAALVVPTHAYAGAKYDWMKWFFYPVDSRSWVSPQEQASLRELDRVIPPGAIVAANPWKGGSYMYVFTGRRMLWPSEKTYNTPDRRLLAGHLDEVGTDPQVCQAATRTGVEWAITGGRVFAWASQSQRVAYAGVDAVGTSAAWQKVAHAEPYTLFRRVQCAG